MWLKVQPTNTLRLQRTQVSFWRSKLTNESITFGANGSARALAPVGFDFSEEVSLSWTTEPCSELEFELALPRKDFFIAVTGVPFLHPGKINRQQLSIFVNGLFCGTRVFHENETHKFPVKRSAISGRTTKLQLFIPTATSPSDLGISADIRALGIAVSAIQISAE